MKKIPILLLIICSLSTSATNYYVATAANGGSDANNGLTGNPVETFARAVALATASGDVINFGVGTFTFTTVSIPVGVSIVGQGDVTILVSNYTFSPLSGTLDASIKLSSTVEGSNGNQSISYLKIIGTGATNGTVAILVRRRSNVIIHHVTVFDFKVGGIWIAGSTTHASTPTVYSTGNQIYNCDLRQCATSDGTYTTWENGGLLKWSGQDGMLVHDNYLSNIYRTAGLNGNNVGVGYGNKGCKFYNNESYLLDQNGTAWNIHIESWELEGGFEIYGNTFIGGDMGVDAGGHYSNTNAYDYTYSIHDNYFAPNVQYGDNYHPINAICIEGLLQQDIFVYDNHFYKHPCPIVIQGTSWGPSITRDIYVFKNLFEACGQNNATNYDNIMYVGAGQSTSTLNNINIVNNTIISDITRNAGIHISTGVGVSLTTLNYKNNIVLNCTNGTFMRVVNNGSMSGLTVTNNLLYGNSNNNLPLFSGNAVTGYTINSNVTLTPWFVGGRDFKLQTTSPARDAGTIITIPVIGQLSYTGTAPDIGNFEYVIPNPEVLATVILDNPYNLTSRTLTVYASTTDDGGGTISEKGLVFGTSSNPTTSNLKIINGSGLGQYFTAINTLLPNTTYFLRAYSINQAGTAYSNQISFKTYLSSFVSVSGKTLLEKGKVFVF